MRAGGCRGVSYPPGEHAVAGCPDLGRWLGSDLQRCLPARSPGMGNKISTPGQRCQGFLGSGSS